MFRRVQSGWINAWAVAWHGRGGALDLEEENLLQHTPYVSPRVTALCGQLLSAADVAVLGTQFIVYYGEC